MDIVKELVIAMMENGYLPKYQDDENKNIEIIAKAYNELYNKIKNAK